MVELRWTMGPRCERQYVRRSVDHGPVVLLHLDGHVDPPERARLAFEQVVIRPRGIERQREDVAVVGVVVGLHVAEAIVEAGAQPRIADERRAVEVQAPRHLHVRLPVELLPAEVRIAEQHRRAARGLEAGEGDGVGTVAVARLLAGCRFIEVQTRSRGRRSAVRVLLLQRAHDRGGRRVGGGVGVGQGEGVSAGDLDDPRRQRVAMLADVEVVPAGESLEHVAERAVQRSHRAARFADVVRAPRRQVGRRETPAPGASPRHRARRESGAPSRPRGPRPGRIRSRRPRRPPSPR